MEQDQRHLDLLSIFHFIAGGINAVFSCFPLIHLLQESPFIPVG